jgi:hypothetical protein
LHNKSNEFTYSGEEISSDGNLLVVKDVEKQVDIINAIICHPN